MSGRELTPKEIPPLAMQELTRLVASKKELGAGATDRTYKEYLEQLPRLNGVTFEAHIDMMLQRKKEIGDTMPVKILEVGYDAGRFLLACREKWGEQVELVGLGPVWYAKETLDSTTGKSYNETLSDNGIQVHDGNVKDIRGIIGDNAADVIIANQVLMHVKYPAWELIKKIYRTLVVGGVAYINSGIQFMSEEGKQWHDKTAIIERFRQASIPVSFGVDSLAMEKAQIDIGELHIATVPHAASFKTKPYRWEVRLF